MFFLSSLKKMKQTEELERKWKQMGKKTEENGPCDKRNFRDN